MRLGKKVFIAFLFAIVPFSANHIVNAQELNLGTATTAAPTYCFGIEPVFLGQYFSVTGTNYKNNGLRAGFGINGIAEYNMLPEEGLAATIEPGIWFTSGRFYQNSAQGYHIKRSLTNLNIPITVKYNITSAAPVGFFVQAGIVPGFNLSQKNTVEQNHTGELNEHLTKIPVSEKSFYLGALIAVGVNLDVLPTGSLQARVGWEPTFTKIATGNAAHNVDLRQNFVFLGVAYKFCQ